MSFRKIIKQEAERQELSGYAIAKMSGVKMRTLQWYLSGNSDMTGEKVAAVAEALGLGLVLVRKPDGSTRSGQVAKRKRTSARARAKSRKAG